MIELETDGIIGKLADTHYSFGYVNNVAPLITETIPDFISAVKAAGTHVVLLVPV
jgi:hypothetical protein